MLTQVGLFPAVINRDVDLLFMIDDSPSMADKQNNLKAAFPALVDQLGATGLPNLHIGIVTSDLGTSAALDAQPGPPIGSGPGACSGLGKNGVLQINGATTTGDKYLLDVDNGSGRQRNYNGTLASAFATAASVGATGCGFEQPIESAKRALDNNAANAGFLRPNASLAIIFLTDEDDCSLAHTSLTSTDTTTFGPLQSFRCTRFGITCDQGGATPDEMNQVGQKVSCHSNDSGMYLTKIADYATFFRGLKPDPRTILVAAIAGPTTPFQVELATPPGGGTAIPHLAHSCMYTDATNSIEVADNGVRVAELAAGFERSSFASVCGADDASLRAIGLQIGALVGNPCLARDIALPPTCELYDQRPGQPDVRVPQCGGATTTDCFTIAPDATTCPAGQHLRLNIQRASAPAGNTMSSLRCAL